MPFVRHMDYGPDQVSIDPDSSEKEWLGAIMDGPLVMAAEGVKSWDEAVLNLGTDGLPEPGSLKLIPDYQADSCVTHYFRIRR